MDGIIGKEIMKRKLKTFSDSNDALSWIKRFKKKSNVIVISSMVNNRLHNDGFDAVIIYDKNMTDQEARNIRNRRQT